MGRLAWSPFTAPSAPRGLLSSLISLTLQAPIVFTATASPWAPKSQLFPGTPSSLKTPRTVCCASLSGTRPPAIAFDIWTTLPESSPFSVTSQSLFQHNREGWSSVQTRRSVTVGGIFKYYFTHCVDFHQKKWHRRSFFSLCTLI